MPNTKKKNTKKTVDLPPTGQCNTDPLSKESGAHPIEVGVGAAVGGAAAGFAAGMAAGPVGAVVGAIAGGVVGGYAGKGIGEVIDPTTEDGWLCENFSKRPYVKKGESFEAYAPAYRYGGQAQAQYHGKPFEEAEPHLRSGWESTDHGKSMAWDRARHAVKDAYDRTFQLREERLKVHKQPVQTGEVKVRKEVVTEHKTIDVPVEREEVVIERRPGSGKAGGDIKAQEIRIPVKEEKVRVSKEAVVNEEVSVHKRKVKGTEHVEGDVRKEKLKVEKEGDAKVRRDKR